MVPLPIVRFVTTTAGGSETCDSTVRRTGPVGPSPVIVNERFPVQGGPLLVELAVQTGPAEVTIRT